MKVISHTLLALIAASGTGSALAQSTVTLYGRIDASIEQQKYGSNKVSGMASNGSFIGLRSQEDLGGNLKAGMVLESLVNVDTGSGVDEQGLENPLQFQRRSEVNLAGSFGMLRLGRFKRASYEATAQAISWHNDNAGSTTDSFSNSSSHANVLAYRSPQWGPLSGELQYRFGEKKTWYDDIKHRDGIDLGLRYDQGPWGLGMGYAESRLKGDVYGDDLKDQTYSLRASYDNGTWALGTYYIRDETREFWPELERFHSHGNTLRIAGKYAWGASEFHASIGRRNSSGTVQSLVGSQPSSTSYKISRNQWLLAYHYKLSPRTRVYAFYGHEDSIPSMQSFPSLWTGESSNFKTMGLGVRHLF